ncbi:MAG: ADP-ribosylglycohydrolase family protein [Deltaproteobacteria bacterium]|nr:ADP-ribosylglycohydrolase family protein [Deltaproteobacteria bacterium]
MSRSTLEQFFDRPTRAVTALSSADLAARYRGVILGVGVGNAFGLPVEGWSKERIKERFSIGMIIVAHCAVLVAAAVILSRSLL